MTTTYKQFKAHIETAQCILYNGEYIMNTLLVDGNQSVLLREYGVESGFNDEIEINEDAEIEIDGNDFYIIQPDKDTFHISILVKKEIK